jgi:hypothetical protein
MRVSLILLALLLARTAGAQEEEARPADLPVPPLVGAETRAEPAVPPPDAPTVTSLQVGKGDKLIVHMPDGMRYSGSVLSLRPGEVTLELRSKQVVSLLVSDVEKLEQEKRPWFKMTLIGGGIGGVVATTFWGLLCLIGASEGEVDVPECTGAGALVGASIGGAIGLVAGLATVRWSTLYDKTKDGDLSLQMEDSNVFSRLSSGTGHRGELGLQLGYARDVGISAPTQGWGGRLHVLLLQGPYFAIGPEFAVYANVGDENQDVGNGEIWRRERYLVQFQGLVRGGTQVGPTRLGLLAGVGVHANRNSHFGGTVGAEVEMRPFERLPPMALEARYHLNLDKHAGVDRQDFLSIGVGSRVRW